MLKQILFVTVALASGLGMHEVAADPTWGGFYVDGAIGARSTATDIKSTERFSYSYIDPFYGFSSTSTDTTTLTNDVGNTSFLGQLSAGWRWDNGQIVAGIGIFVDLADDDAGNAAESYASSYSLSSPYFSYSGSDSDSYKEELKQTSRYGISVDIAPSWRTQPYLKLAYAWSDIELKASTSDCGLPGLGPTALSFDETFSGFGIGGGVRHLYNDNLYFFAEVMWQELGSESWNGAPLCSGLSGFVSPGASLSETLEIEVEPTNLTGVLGIGWKF